MTTSSSQSGGGESPTKSKRILIWRDKRGNVHYDAESSTELYIASLKILQERLDNGYLFYPDGAEDRAKRILDGNKGDDAWKMLQERTDHEYEGVKLEWLQ